MSDAWVQLVPFAFWIVISVIPSVKLLRRVGLHPALAALNLLPFVGPIVILWIVAYSAWPKVQA